MGIQDRDYYREKHRAAQREADNENFFVGRKPFAWGRLVVLALMCAVVYLGMEVLRLRSELAKADRVIQQQTAQLKADRQRSAR